MPGLLDKFFACFLKKLSVFEKYNGLLFFRFDNCGPLEGEHGANVSKAFFINTNLLGSSSFSLLNTFCKFYRVPFDGQYVDAYSLAAIRCEKNKMH